jgi:serine/threonine-protein kinase RsbW
MSVPDQTSSGAADQDDGAEMTDPVTGSQANGVLPASEGPGTSDIELALPADANHVPVARALAADLATRLDFDLDEVSDLRMAVDEACAELVARSAEPHRLRCVFRVDDARLRIEVCATTKDGATPERSTFGWRVLTALVDEVETWADADRTVHVELLKWRAGVPA